MEPTPRNPFAPPASPVADGGPNAAITPKSRLYTPAQIRVGTFVGGPIAAAYLLRENFLRLGRGSEARTTVLWGVALTAALMALAPVLPKNVPNVVIPLLYSIVAGSVAEKWQLRKQAIRDSGWYQIQSNWRVLGISLLFMIAFT